MAAQFIASSRANLWSPLSPTGLGGSRRTLYCRELRVFSSPPPPSSSSSSSSSSPPPSSSTSYSSSATDGDSYLDMWKKAMERERKSQEFRWIAENSGRSVEAEEDREGEEGSLGQKADLFSKIQEVPREKRDHIQRLQVIDRAAAAIAAARALVKESPPRSLPDTVKSDSDGSGRSSENGGTGVVKENGLQDGKSFASEVTLGRITPGPDFWSWSPPLDDKSDSRDVDSLNPARKLDTSPNPSISLMEKGKPADYLSIPFQSTLNENRHSPPLPPLQSLVEVEKAGSPTDQSNSADQHMLEELFSGHAAEAAEALGKSGEASSRGVSPDGSKWWKETGVERRSDGVICKWTLTRGVSADGAIEWEDKFWEASDQYDYKELGSEKSGRDAAGNVWREFWKELMWQDLKTGLPHIEKTADKWGKKSGEGDEWHEKWYEHYDGSGDSEKWAHKWCSIDPNTQLEAGHAHVWHERWGETYDGKGGSIKYTDKWAERSEGDDGWSKWGDKWDEHFDWNGHGVKQGETWWEGKFGERWNRTWGEGHNGTGWIHKYGKSSSGEHWDTHEQQDTWYESYPHYGFELCMENSQQLRAVQKPTPENLED